MILVDFDEDGTKLKVRYEITPPLLTLVSKYVFLFSGPLITERTKRAKAVLSGTRRFSGCKYLGSCSTMHTSVELVRICLLHCAKSHSEVVIYFQYSCGLIGEELLLLNLLKHQFVFCEPLYLEKSA